MYRTLREVKFTLLMPSFSLRRSGGGGANLVLGSEAFKEEMELLNHRQQHGGNNNSSSSRMQNHNSNGTLTSRTSLALGDGHGTIVSRRSVASAAAAAAAAAAATELGENPMSAAAVAAGHPGLADPEEVDSVRTRQQR